MTERQSKTAATDAPRTARPAPHGRDGLASLQHSAGNRAVASLLGPSEPRSVQRDDDDWSLGSMVQGASSLVDSAESGASSALNYVNTPFRNAATSIGQGVDAYAGLVDTVENAEHAVVHGAADAVSGVPVLGDVAQGAATTIDTATQLVGGFDEGVVGIAGGLAKGLVDPVDTAKGLYGLAQKLPPSVMLGAGEQAVADLATGKGLDAAENDITGGVEKSFNNIWGGIGEGADAANPNGLPKDAGLVRGILNPVYGDVARGKGAHAAGRVGANVASVVFGGEIAEAADAALGAEAATGSEAATAGSAAEAAAGESAPATLRDPPVGDANSLSPAGQKAFDGALADGRSPAQAFQEAQGLDEAAKAAGLGPKPAALAPEGVPTPAGLTEDAESVFRHAVENGESPAEAERLARDLDASKGGSTGLGENAAGRTAQRGPKRSF